MRAAYHTLQRTIPRGAKTIHPDTHTRTHRHTRGQGVERFTQNRRHILGCISHDVFNVQPNTVQYQTLQTFTQCKSNLDTLTYIHFCTHTHTPSHADCSPNKQADQPLSCLEPGTRETASRGPGRFLIIHAHYKHLFLLI